MKKLVLLAALSTLIFTSCTFEKAEPFVEECPDAVLFQTQVKPFVDAKCVTCHVSGGTGTGDFTVFSEFQARALNGVLHDKVFVAKSMPPGGNPQLTEGELQLLKCWIKQGALDN